MVINIRSQDDVVAGRRSIRDAQDITRLDGSAKDVTMWVWRDVIRAHNFAIDREMYAR